MKILPLLAAALLLAGCSKDIQNKEAIKQSVMDYLNARAAQTGLDMGSMDVDVNAMTFQRDEARATVAFRTKAGQGVMEMNYTFDRKGDKWVVRAPSRSDGVAAHGELAPNGMPPGMPSGAPPNAAIHGGVASPGDVRPGAGLNLPPDHPAIGSTTPGTTTPGSKE